MSDRRQLARTLLRVARDLDRYDARTAEQLREAAELILAGDDLEELEEPRALWDPAADS